MNHISLFSGIGGFELAAEWAGWNNIASCEINPFGRKVLQYYWPNAYHHDDIHTLTKEILDEKTKWKSDELILTGGFPCQPYSVAGKRLGKEDERHLWPEMLRIIRELKPSWVVGENVFGLVNWNDGLVFDEVQADLEAEGYEVQAFVFPACAVNAPHTRNRLFVIANTYNKGLQRRKKKRNIKKGKQEANKQSARFFYTNWEVFPTQSPVCHGDDGLSARLDGITFSKWRNESIKAGGNAIVPQVVYQIFKAINFFNNQKF
jgi:DNA (cytosine-5)-methyltransferase 1